MKTLDNELLTDVWENKNAKATKQAIQRFDLKQGSLFGLGAMSSKKNYLIIRNVKSSFASHKYAFGDET